ncbi:MAG TPA: lysozyme inhibitor LprI family protein [Pirellulales bacterium]|nr:lysozyme inhibitor LprI family protein [Pirellulales bacterium]
MKFRWHLIRLGRIYRIALLCFLALSPSLVVEPGHAQTRKPIGREVAAIHDCAKKSKDNLDDGERRCLFNLVATPCINKLPKVHADHAEVDCYSLENSIWDDLLNQNYKRLLDTLDDDQKAKARTMQSAGIAATPLANSTTTRSRARWRR